MDTIDEYNIQVICVEKNGESISQHKDEMRLYCECGQLDNGIIIEKACVTKLTISSFEQMSKCNKHNWWKEDSTNLLFIYRVLNL